MKRLIDISYCHWCGEPIPSFTVNATHEIIIRRYVGGQGHLIDFAFHTGCYRQYHFMMTLGGITNEL